MKYAFGVDVGGTTVKLGLFTVQGELIEKWEIKTVTDNNGERILPDIADAIDAKLEERAIDRNEVKGIGLGIPGPIDDKGNVINAVNLGWGVFNIEETFSKLTGFEVKAGNDANVAALGEQWKGAGRGCRSIIMLTFGTGVGGGIVIDGHIHAGENGAGGELGHIPVCDPEDEPRSCGCGKRGCLEQYASANGIVYLAQKYLAAHPCIKTPLRDCERLSSKIIFDEAKKGDKAALDIADRLFRYAGKAMATVAVVTDPEMFVLGGGMSKAGDILVEGIEKYYKIYAFHSVRDTKIRLAQLGNDAGIYGSVKQIL